MTDELRAQYRAAAEAEELTAPPMSEPARRRLVDATIRAQKIRQAA